VTIYSSYDIRIPTREFNKAFADTTEKYRAAVAFFIFVRLEEAAAFSELKTQHTQLRKMELLTNRTKDNPDPKYDFGKDFYKFPSYLRRSAIAEALGKVSSYESNLALWNRDHKGKEPGKPAAGYVYPALYRDNTYVRVDDYFAQIKVWIRNTWDWITVPLRKTDVSYIRKYCSGRIECIPTLRKKHNYWVLSFSFEEKVKLTAVPRKDQIILSVDLGINSACVCTAMRSDGTILGRKFLNLPKEEDSLMHALNRIKKAQQNGNRKTPSLWARAKGINDRISVLTAQFIVDTAVLFSAFTIVFESLDIRGKKKGSRSKRQRVHHWRAQYVQGIVTAKAHRLGIRISRVNAWNTSALAYDGSGKVIRGKEAGFKTNAICRFQNGKTYNCDLNASYNIGARYFIREILKSLPATERLRIEAKVPQCSKRSTSTYATFINLCAELHAVA
jgi:IS605 OrfB family transposase